jgi:hypothetical protein
MDIDTNIIKEQVRELNRSLNRECEQLQEQMEKINNHLWLLDQFESVLKENEQLRSELEQQQAENDRLHEQLDDKDMKLNELNKFSVGMAKKSSQEGLEKAFRIYINTSKRKTQAKREVARAQLLDFIATAKLDMPEDIMELLNHLDDEQPESAPMTNVTVQAGGINVQQANTVVR